MSVPWSLRLHASEADFQSDRGPGHVGVVHQGIAIVVDVEVPVHADERTTRGDVEPEAAQRLPCQLRATGTHVALRDEAPPLRWPGSQENAAGGVKPGSAPGCD